MAQKTPTKLARVLAQRALSYENAAREIRDHYSTAHDGAELRLTGNYLGLIARGRKPASLRLARALVAWVDNRRALKVADLIEVEP